MEGMRGPRSTTALASALLALALPACSIKKLAVNSLGNALAEGGSSYASDDDPELVREAVPFGLKTVGGLVERSAAPKQQANAPPGRRTLELVVADNRIAIQKPHRMGVPDLVF